MNSRHVRQRCSYFLPTDARKTDAEKDEEADAAILAAIASRRKLASDLELAKGIQYTKPIETSCAPFPSYSVKIH